MGDSATYGTWFGVQETRTAEVGEWSISTPVMHGAGGGMVIGVPLHQSVMLPVVPCEMPDAKILGVSMDGRVLCDVDGVRSWAVPTRQLHVDEHGVEGAGTEEQ